MNTTAFYHGADGRTRSRTTAAATGAAVVGVCFAYAGWSLLAGRSDEAEPSVPGVNLGLAPAQAPDLSPPPEAAPMARLTLDDGTSLGAVPVTNAHLEVSVEDLHPEGISPAVQQLGFEPRSATRPVAGAWLTGTIEPAGSAALPTR